MNTKLIHGLDCEWDQTDDGHRAVYMVPPDEVPVAFAARVIYELRLDCERLNSEVLELLGEGR
jgi:hypothetical protein